MEVRTQYVQSSTVREHGVLDGVRRAPHGHSAGMRLAEWAGQIMKGLINHGKEAELYPEFQGSPLTGF